MLVFRDLRYRNADEMKKRSAPDTESVEGESAFIEFPELFETRRYDYIRQSSLLHPRTRFCGWYIREWFLLYEFRREK